MLDLMPVPSSSGSTARALLVPREAQLLEQRPTWAARKPRAITTTLPPLTPEDARLVAEHLLGPQAPILVVDRVETPPRGTPRLEQLTAMLADQGLLANGRWVGSDDADVEIPMTCRPFSPQGSIASIPCRV